MFGSDKKSKLTKQQIFGLKLMDSVADNIQAICKEAQYSGNQAYYDEVKKSVLHLFESSEVACIKFNFSDLPFTPDPDQVKNLEDMYAR